MLNHGIAPPPADFTRPRQPLRRTLFHGIELLQPALNAAQPAHNFSVWNFSALQRARPLGTV